MCLAVLALRTGKGGLLNKGEGPRGLVLALATVLPLTVIHLVMTWGYIEWPFGDYGVWLHQVERFAEGETPYRDFAWQFPPLSIWVFGGLGRVLGTELTDIWLVSGGLYIAVSVAFAWWCATLLPRPWVGVLAPTVFLVGIAFSAFESAPIGMGMYTPAAPLGVLWLLLLGSTLVRYHRSPGPVGAAAVGALAAACLLTKQDFWLPALTAGLAGVLFALQRGRVRHAAIVAVAGSLTVGTASAVVLSQAGAPALLAIPGGFGFADVFGIGRMLPTWERLVLEGATASLAVAVLCGAAATAGAPMSRLRRPWTISITLFLGLAGVAFAASKQLGDAWPRMALQDGLHLHAFSLLLPVVAGVVLWRERDRLAGRTELQLLAVLLLFLLAARGRRGFERVEGYQILFELPVYAAVVHALWRDQAKRAGLVVVPMLVVLGVYTYRSFEEGPLTLAGAQPSVMTSRGAARFPAGVNFAAVEAAVGAAAESDASPVFSFGHNGAFAYFFERPNPTPLTFGFQIGLWNPDDVVDGLAGRSFVAIYRPIYENVQVPMASLSLTSWRQPGRLNHYMALDLPYWRRALARCTATGSVSRFGRPHYEIYSC